MTHPSPAIERALTAALSELSRAVERYPLWPTDPLHALAVLQEEVGELTQAVLQVTYEPAKGSTVADVRAEAVQVAAMALRFLAAVDDYTFAKSAQRDQGPAPVVQPLQPFINEGNDQ